MTTEHQQWENQKQSFSEERVDIIST